ncbi:GPI transamidase component [Teratosphaeriaceae sp. CCFEE 6253]|nr:GPI transamidase component [Teratosphaeriaceae sp. CCFEE 6253]
MAGSDGAETTVADELANSPAEAKPTPPPETPSSQRTRRWIVLSFWAIVVCFGLPHWIWTTSTYRAKLPLEMMNSWAEGKTCQLHYPLPIRLTVPAWESGQEEELAVQLRNRLGATSGLHDMEAIVGESEFADGTPMKNGDEALKIVLDVSDDPSAHEQSSRLESWDTILRLNYGLARPGGRDGLARWVANEIEQVFAAEQLSLAYLLGGTPFVAESTAMISPEIKAKLDARSTRAFKYASTYHLTFSLFASSSSPSAWDIEAALGTYVNPLVDALSRISNITVDTQVQLHASLSPSIAGPQYDAACGEWKLKREDLSGFINAAEWPLSPSIGEGPTINFVLYVPAPEQSPLVIESTGGTSWLVPQWGGVAILSPQNGSAARLTMDELEPVMLTFADQLTSLIGLPPSPPSLALRLESLERERTTSLILSASSTLGALARLTLKLPNIAIPDSVATSVSLTIQNLDAACGRLRAGRYASALAHARIANDEAEKAFFEPSMVGQVYFPDEHKVAVYVPLLGPMAVPLVLAGLKEVKRWRESVKVKDV